MKVAPKKAFTGGQDPFDQVISDTITRLDRSLDTHPIGYVIAWSAVVTGAVTGLVFTLGFLAEEAPVIGRLLGLLPFTIPPVGWWVAGMLGALLVVRTVMWAWRLDGRSPAPERDDPHTTPPPARAHSPAPQPPARGDADRARQIVEGALGISETPHPASAPTRADDAEDAQPTDAPPALAHAQVTVTADAGAAAARAQAILGKPVGEPRSLHVRATRTHADGAPKQFEITYPPRALTRVSGMLPEIRQLVTDAFPPREDEWATNWKPAEDRLLLTDSPDPLARPVPLPELGAPVDIYKGVPMGITEKGDPYLMPLLEKHILIAGDSGSGKGSWIQTLLLSLAPLAKDQKCRFHLVDPKGGVELTPYADIAGPGRGHSYADNSAGDEAITKALLNVEQIMTRKQATLKELRARKITRIERSTPLDVVVVDELANVVGKAVSSAAAQENKRILVRILTQGRATQVLVVGAVQDPRKDNLDLRGLFLTSVCLRVSEAPSVDLVLNKGARNRGALADMISTDLPGIGYVVTDGQVGFQRVRPPFLRDADVEDVVAYLTEPYPS